MAKHTPGPWFADEPHSGDADRAVYSLTAVNKSRHYVARVYGGGPLAPRDPEMDANARLIAAAPDMLRALERLVWLNTSQGVSDYDYDTAMENANAAIARAHGEG